MIFPIDSSMSQCFYISPLLLFRNGFLKQTAKEHRKTISHIQSQTLEFVAGHHMGGGGLVAQLCLTLAAPWTVAHQAPVSMGFSRQGDWSGLPCPFPENLPNPGMEPGSPAFEADSLPTELQGKAYHVVKGYSLMYHL